MHCINHITENMRNVGSVAGHQLQQNQLVLSLNQSYFQLVNNQNALVDRFNRLEQLVLGSTSGSSNVMVDTYGQLSGPLGDDVDSAPHYSLFTGAQSPFNLNNCKCICSNVIWSILLANTNMLVFLIVRPKCMLAVSHVAPW